MGKGMIVAPQPEAVEAGAIVLKNGGNAVDAAVTCALVQTVVDPQMSGIAGFGTMHLYFPSKDFHGFIDEVKVYPYVRTAAEINQDYAAGLSGMKSPAGISAAFPAKSNKWVWDYH